MWHRLQVSGALHELLCAETEVSLSVAGALSIDAWKEMTREAPVAVVGVTFSTCAAKGCLLATDWRASGGWALICLRLAMTVVQLGGPRRHQLPPFNYHRLCVFPD